MESSSASSRRQCSSVAPSGVLELHQRLLNPSMAKRKNNINPSSQELARIQEPCDKATQTCQDQQKGRTCDGIFRGYSSPLDQVPKKEKHDMLDAEVTTREEIKTLAAQ